MSNRIYIDVNKIENHKTKEVYYSIKAGDDYSSGSVRIEKKDIPKEDIDILKYCLALESMPEGMKDAIDSVSEFGKGININDTFYEWAEISYLFGIE